MKQKFLPLQFYLVPLKLGRSSLVFKRLTICFVKLSNFDLLHAHSSTLIQKSYFSPYTMNSGSSSLAKNWAAVFLAGKLLGFVSSDDSSFSGSAAGVVSGGYNAPNISFNFLLA